MVKTLRLAITGVFAFGLFSLSALGQAQRHDVSLRAKDLNDRAGHGNAIRRMPLEPITISMTADRWQTKENAEFLRQLGFFQGLMRLNSGNAVLKGVTFGDGTIEFDVNMVGRGAP